MLVWGSAAVKRLKNTKIDELYHGKDQINLPKTVSPTNSHRNMARNNK